MHNVALSIFGTSFSLDQKTLVTIFFTSNLRNDERIFIRKV
jgi:hypothetical protein